MRRMSDQTGAERLQSLLAAQHSHAAPDLRGMHMDDSAVFSRDSSLAATLGDHIAALRTSPQFIDTWADAEVTARLCIELAEVIKLRLAWQSPRSHEGLSYFLAQQGKPPTEQRHSDESLTFSS